MRKITFIHAADLHLDSPFTGTRDLPRSLFQRVQESTFSALDTLITAALEHQVDFVLLCGDLFDGEDRSIKAQARLRRQLERLMEANIKVFLLHGNHDHLSGTWTTIEMPDNVQLFSSKVEKKEYIKKDGTKVHLYGFSYEDRHVMERKIDDYEKIGDAHFHIGMLHGHCEGGSALHQPYAPFSLRDLLGKEMDYWALGHIHKSQILHRDPVVAYAGNTQGRNSKEADEKGCYIVSLSDYGHTDITFIETADIIWKSITISLQDVRSFSQLYLICEQMLDEVRREEQGIFLKIILHHGEQLFPEAVNKYENGELKEALQDGEEEERAFVWTYAIEMKNNHSEIMNDLRMDRFGIELEKSIVDLAEDADVFEEAIASLYTHIYGSRYLDPLTNEEKDALREKAKYLLFQYLQEENR